jgi:hypothetical protein
MTWLETWRDAVADRIHAPGDAAARAAGLTVERLPGGRRRISDPRVPIYAERRRLRIARTGGDAIDQALTAYVDRPGVGASRAGRDGSPRLA